MSQRYPDYDTGNEIVMNRQEDVKIDVTNHSNEVIQSGLARGTATVTFGEESVAPPGGAEDGEEEEEEVSRCGVCGIHPGCLQPCASVPAFSLTNAASVLCQQTLFAFLPSQLTSIERQFGISSTVSGLLLSCNDVGYLLTVLLTAHVGRRLHIPRLLGLMGLLYGVAGLLPCLAHLLHPATLPHAGLTHPGTFAHPGTPTLPPGTLTHPGTPTLPATLSQPGNITYPDTLPHPGTSHTTSIIHSTSLLSSDSSAPEPDVAVSANQSRSAAWDQYLCTSGARGDHVTGAGVPDGAGSVGDSEQGSGWRMGVYLLGASYVLQGVAKTVRNPLPAHYVDNNVRDKTRTGFYLGLAMTAQVLGTPVAQAAAALFSKLPVDLQHTTLTVDDPRWVGAWWLGFAAFSLLSLLAALPVACFPRAFRRGKDRGTGGNQETGENLEARGDQGAKGSQGGEEDEKCQQQGVTQGRLAKTWHILKDLPLSMRRVLRSPVVSLALAGMVLYAFAISGFVNFGNKYLERQFNVPAFTASTILSVANLTSTVIGTFLGGYITRRFRLSRLGCSRFSVVVTMLSCAFGALQFLFGCSNQDIVGLTHNNGTSTVPGAECECDVGRVLLSCGEDGRSYLSPCLAGCTLPTNTGYGGCGEGVGSVRPGMCPTDCPYLWPYVVSGAFMAVTGSLAITPKCIILIRSVEDRDKSMVIAIFSFLSSLFAWLPAPLVYGWVIDQACLVWGRNSACALYDIEALRYNVIGLETAFKVVGTIAFILVLWGLRREGEEDWRERDGGGGKG